MKGIVFNLLEECVSREHGEETWDALLDEADLNGAYTSLGSYDDADLLKLVAAASTSLGVDDQEVVRWFGRSALPLLADRYPDFFQQHGSTRPFLLTLNEIIHPEVRKIYPGADVPTFDFNASSDDELVMGYRSQRRLCAFGEGLIEGAAAHYGERVEIRQPVCMRQGGDRCEFRVRLSS